MPKTSNLPVTAVILLLASSITGCATITKSGSQAITITSDPPGATCTLSREGSVIGAIPQTPGTLQLDKDKDAIAVSCKKDGYFEAVQALEADFQGMTFGNILFGGLIGVAVDGMTGAMHQYPAMVKVLLTPESFESTGAKDKFFSRRRSELLEEHTATVESIRKNCEEEGCEGQIKAAKEYHDSRIALLEAKRSQALVRQ